MKVIFRNISFEFQKTAQLIKETIPFTNGYIYNYLSQEVGKELKPQTSSVSSTTDAIDISNVEKILFTGIQEGYVATWTDADNLFVGASVLSGNITLVNVNIMDEKPVGAKYVYLQSRKEGLGQVPPSETPNCIVYRYE
jgi:hypothetical protein